MKSTWQIVFGLFILTAIVLGATYFTQFTTMSNVPTPAPPPPNGDGPDRTEPMLRFAKEVADWKPELFPLDSDQDREKFVRSVELGIKNHYVFWAHNPQPEPVDMLVKATTCTCSEVEYAVFSAEAWSSWQRQEGLTETLRNLLGAPVVNPAAAGLLQSVTWQKLPGINEAGPYARLQPVSQGGPPAMVRVNFQPKKLSGDQNGETLYVAIRGQSANGVKRDDKQLMVKYEVVPPLGVLPMTLDMGQIGAGGKATRSLLVWTVTRDKLEPELSLSGPDATAKGDPCIEFGKPEFLTPEQLARLPTELGKEYKLMRPKCACTVPVTIYERRGDRQLDMGPVNRTIILSLDSATDPVKIPMTALVRGEVRVFGADERDRIALGSFNRGVKKTVSLATTHPDVDLEFDETATSALVKHELSKPESLPDGSRQWQLTVEIPADTVAGELSPGTAVVLSIKGPKPRKMRIPVTGTAAR